MTHSDPRMIDRLIEGILDTEPANWPRLDSPTTGAEGEIGALQTLSDIARAFRRLDAPPPTDLAAPLFHWGHLAVRERIATGGSSEVYRAWDQALGVPVALKLLRTDAATPGTRMFLDEAKRLARVRQHNVLSVYGAAVHDARPGLWCEWIDGQTIAHQIEDRGPLGIEETVALGGALCRALSAVHAAGLLHGDVKPDNVLRERGGRIVLADLGAGGEPDAVNASLRSAATPAWLAPEVMRGAARTPQQDLYALGGVLQYALDGRVPDPSRPGVTLVRADVPAALRAVIAKARAADPGERYACTDEMQQDLAACFGTATTPRRRNTKPRTLLVALASAAVLLVALAAGWWWQASPPVLPDVDIALLRHHDAISEPIADGTPVAVGDRLSFALRGSRPLWLYAYNADDRGELQQLFPLHGLDTTNPLPSGHTVEIPGRSQGRLMRFEVSSSASAEEFLLVVAPNPIARLESDHYRAAPADVEPRPRGTARLVPAVPERPGTRLDTLAAELAAGNDTLRMWRFRLPHREKPAAPRQ